eukprot:4950267-Alexandrium_andersonii.AAC.1
MCIRDSGWIARIAGGRSRAEPRADSRSPLALCSSRALKEAKEMHLLDRAWIASRPQSQSQAADAIGSLPNRAIQRTGSCDPGF